MRPSATARPAGTVIPAAADTGKVNGAEVGRDLLSNMGWTFETLIGYAARDSVVVPGDVLGSGTVGNGGCLAELWGRHGRQDPPPLRDGDVVTLTVEGTGSLTNRVVTAAPAPEDTAGPAPRPGQGPSGPGSRVVGACR
ncbi:fumarylacetoacetate hydrolase family protein [Actinoplanes couchii]|uniref:Fumarylacetoacetase-like C-terminal domain-containing protein n=1 Tax=Actinoplanes couchii TaxID=403638 RepID=A0ABQ3XM92_9ACTN|nr:fumarylacetoacetate hydrolase family protein [Actinoplanes couchii]MDR6321514.1 hypothetical protein [Actinoplanes couchii]GID59611.1 hypothetical protein Aco03nite_080150 [Actinoplanes couchii]